MLDMVRQSARMPALPEQRHSAEQRAYLTNLAKQWPPLRELDRLRPTLASVHEFLRCEEAKRFLDIVVEPNPG